MCFAIEKIKPHYFEFEHDLYSREATIMKKRIEKLTKKIEKNEARRKRI